MRAPLRGLSSAMRCSFNPPGLHTPERPGKGRGIGCGLRQSVRRLAAGQGVLTAMEPCLGSVIACWGAELRQFQEARLCAARGALTKTGLRCNSGRRRQLLGHASGMTAASTASRCCGVLKLHQELAQWTRLTRKRSLMGQRDHRLKRNGVALTEGEIDGCCRCA